MTDAERRALRALVMLITIGQALIFARAHWPRLLPDVMHSASSVAVAHAFSATDSLIARASTPAARPLRVGSPASIGDAPHVVDINSADASAWCALPGIGAKKAAAILAERRRGGPFLRVQDLTRVKGIGPATVARLRPWLQCVAPGRAPSPRER